MFKAKPDGQLKGSLGIFPALGVQLLKSTNFEMKTYDQSEGAILSLECGRSFCGAEHEEFDKTRNK